VRIVKILTLLLFVSSAVYTQTGFILPHKVASDKIPFKLVNNLVVVPVVINGTELSFILDTGVKTTILFGSAQQDTVEVKNVKPIKLRGLGEGGSINALRSESNVMRIGDAVDWNHTVYVVFEESLNFSPRMGIPVHGIVGYDFFKNFVVKTNYASKRLTAYAPEYYSERKCRSCQEFKLVINKSKPYIRSSLVTSAGTKEVTLLVDSGSSDALWLFEESYAITEDPVNYFVDFLGLGLSGNIFGKRSKLESLVIGEYVLKDVNVAFPDRNALGNMQINEQRAGSIGGDVLKRFTVIMDYPNRKMILRKNSNFKDPFYYNMSGLTIEHDGVVMVEDEKKLVNNPLSFDTSDINKFAFEVIKKSAANLMLAPKLVVAEIREGSPAALEDIRKGDEIKHVNGKPAHKYTLYDLMDLFTSKAGKRISMDIERDGVILKKQFVLTKVI